MRPWWKRASGWRGVECCWSGVVRMSELPSGWVTAPIGDLCTLKNGRAFKPSDWSATGVPIVRIQNLNNPAAPHNYYHGSVDERHRLRGGELLFAWSGTPGTSFGAHIWRGGEAVLNQHIFRVDFDGDALDKRFFRFAINARLDDLIGVAHGGVGLRHVTKGVLSARRSCCRHARSKPASPTNSTPCWPAFEPANTA